MHIQPFNSLTQNAANVSSRPTRATSGDGFAPGQASETGLMQPVNFGKPAQPAGRPLWSDVERLGIWTSVNAIPGPLSAALSAPGVADFKQLLGEFDKAGFKFSDIGDPNQPRNWGSTDRTPEGVEQIVLEDAYRSNMLSRLTMSQPLEKPPEERMFERHDKDVVKQVKIHSFQDLKDAESIFLAGDLDRLKDPALGRRLQSLEQAGVNFRILEAEGREGYSVGEALKNNASRPVGLYGAYRALERDETDARSLWARVGDGKGMYPVSSVADLETVEFFALGSSSPTLDKDPLAQRLRDLGSIGLTFHRGDDSDVLDAAGAFHAIREQRYSMISVSLDGVAKEKIELHTGSGIPQPSKRLLGLAEFHHRVVDSDPALSANEKKFYAHGLTWASDNLSLDETLATIHTMRDFEAGLNPSLEGDARTRMGVMSFGNLMRSLGPGQNPSEMIGEYQELRRRGVQPEVASKALAHFRDKLKPQTFDQAEYAEERERILEISEFANSFDDAADARRVLKMEVAEPYPDRLGALRHLVGVESKHVKASWSNKNSAVKEALLDYRTVLASPRQSLQSAAELLGQLNDALVPRLGHQGSRDMYDYLQRGITRKAFGAEAVGVFAREFDLAKDVDFARNFLQANPAVPEPFEVRSRAAATLRQGLAGLEKAGKPEFDINDPFDEKPRAPGRDRPSEEYRHLFTFPQRNLEQDAASLVSIYQAVVPGSSFEKGREIFDQMKAGQLGSEADFVPRFTAEMALTGDVELGRRGLAGDFPGTTADRAALKAATADVEDFKAVLTQHVKGERLEDESASLAMIRQALEPTVGPEQSRAAFGELMSSLREGPWSGRSVKDATTEFIRNYALKNDLRHALDSLQMSPEGKSGVQETDRQVIIGGVRIRRR